MPQSLLSNSDVKHLARQLGFLACGIAPLHPVHPEVARHYASWLECGHHARMHYLEQYRQLRIHPDQLLPGAKSIVCVALQYHPSSSPTQQGLAWYAQGKDYHLVLKRKLQVLQQALGVEGRCFVDTAPVMEKYWACQAGIGFVGRNTQLVIPQVGSAFFLGELVVASACDVYDKPMEFSHHPCGTCRRCIEACPTQALSSDGLNANRCISYHTIENRDALLPDFVRLHLGTCFYGCDRCLRACPHLRQPQQPTDPDFLPSPELLQMQPLQWKKLTVEQYRKLFKDSAVKRAKYEGLMRNIGSLACDE